jgi:hypothetical protein
MTTSSPSSATTARSSVVCSSFAHQRLRFSPTSTATMSTPNTQPQADHVASYSASSRQTPIPVNLRFGLSALPFTALQLRTWGHGLVEERPDICLRQGPFFHAPTSAKKSTCDRIRRRLCCISGRLKLHRVCRTPPQTLEGLLPADGDVNRVRGAASPPVCVSGGRT